jgi:hypothetical protein
MKPETLTDAEREKIKEVDMEYGLCEGDTCKRDGCRGVIETHPVKNCSCHISPPCSACTSPRNYCPDCAWEEADDEFLNEDFAKSKRETGVYEVWSPRPLDPTKIDWRSQSHSSCSMIKEGVYPEGTTGEEVEKLVRGTFGGKFEYFGGGKFKYIAYTD